MTVTLTSPVLGKNVGDTHTGPEEDWLLAQGYASKAGYADNTSAVLTGASNAVNIVTGGNLVLRVNGTSHTVALANGDTPAQAATKVDTALSGDADSAVASSKFTVTTVATGQAAEIVVVSGAGTILANLGLSVGQRANGGEGGPGVSNVGATDVAPAKDLTLAANREPAPKGIDPAHPGGQLPDPGKLDPAMTFSTADDDPTDPPADPAYDFDQGGVNDDAPSAFTVEPAGGAAAGGTDVLIKGQNLTGVTGVTFGGVAATSVVVVDDETLTCTTGAHAAGAVPVVVTNPTGSKTQAGAYTYA